jgi:hypothetical protein
VKSIATRSGKLKLKETSKLANLEVWQDSRISIYTCTMKIIQFEILSFSDHQLIDFAIFMLYTLITLLTYWRIQRVKISRTFCQNRVEITHFKVDSLFLKIKNNGGSPSLNL